MMLMPRKLLAATLLGTTLLRVVACNAPESTSNDSNTLADDSQATRAVETPKLLSADVLEKYKKALPKVAFGKLQKIFDDPGTFWYDHNVMVPSYQDTVAPDVTVGCRPNSEGPGLINIIPGGRQMFSPDGKDFNFPFARTAGTDASTTTHIVDFLWLPVVNGERQPVVYWINRGSRSSFGLVQWKWMFPKGTIFGEMIYVKDSAGNLYPAELRTRERFPTGWATNAYRPFPTATTLSAAIKRARPSWETTTSLKAMIDHLGNSGTLAAKSVGSKVYPGVYEQEGAIDTIPDLGDEALTKELLTNTTFVSSYGETWKSNGSLKTFAASTSGFGVVPNNYDAGLVEVRDTSCQRCHKDAQRSIEDFNEAAVLYGDVWGSDQIFSFHPFDRDRCHGAAEDNRALNPEFKRTGFVQQYDKSVHKAELYQELK